MSKKKRPTPVLPEAIEPLFDAHTHLSSTAKRSPRPENTELSEQQAYEAAVAELVERAGRAGVQQICTVGDGLAEAEQALQIAQAHENVWAACAIHPTRANELDEPAKARLEALAKDDNCVAVGETGLDAYWIKHDEATPSLEVQEEAFRWHIDLAVRTGKALMIHNREADQDLLRILADAPAPKEVILHCFSSPLEVAKQAIEAGYVLSFAGNVTFKRNAELREAARIAPAEQILVETDAPYMTPEPFRGARNEPGFVGYTARCIAEVRDQSPESLAAQTFDNARRVFQLG